MKICAISDVHAPRNKKGLEKTVKALEGSDALVIAGDISGSKQRYSETLRNFQGFRGLKVAVLGNHDLYVGNGENSYNRIAEIGEICRDQGFHLLDSAPVVYRGVGFVGNVGWYDYSFAQKTPGEGIVLTNGEEWYEKDLGELVDEDFKMKRCLTDEGVSYWADAEHIKWNYSDKEFLGMQLRKLETDLETVSQASDKIVYVSHHIPVWDFIEKRENDPKWSFFNAYQGSPRLGELAMSNPKVSTIICGHSHLNWDPVRKGEVNCYDVSQELGEMEPTLIEV